MATLPESLFSWSSSGWFSSDDLASAAVQLLPIWFFGAIVGLLVSLARGACSPPGPQAPSLITTVCCLSVAAAASQVTTLDVRGGFSKKRKNIVSSVCCLVLVV